MTRGEGWFDAAFGYLLCWDGGVWIRYRGVVPWIPAYAGMTRGERWFDAVFGYLLCWDGGVWIRYRGVAPWIPAYAGMTRGEGWFDAVFGYLLCWDGCRDQVSRRCSLDSGLRRNDAG